MKNFEGGTMVSHHRKSPLLSDHSLLLSMLVLATFFLTGCAEVQPNIQPCLTGSTYGFWGGLWHGIIAPFAWVASLFMDDVAVWAVNNNGGWYTFGFILGIGALSGGSSKAASR